MALCVLLSLPNILFGLPLGIGVWALFFIGAGMATIGGSWIRDERNGEEPSLAKGFLIFLAIAGVGLLAGYIMPRIAPAVLGYFLDPADR